MRRIVFGFLCATLVSCGGGSPSPRTVSASAEPTPSAAASSSAGSGGGNPVRGADFCTFLSRESPRLKAAGSTAGALADLAIEFASWLDTHQAEKPRTAADLDEASSGSCPATRGAVLASLGKNSFAAALS